MAFNKLYDGTPRPDWARDVDVKVMMVPASKSLSERRKNPRLLGGENMVKVPRSISATVLPVSTKKDQDLQMVGRQGTPDVHGRKLKQLFLDRGHLMAFSLGAPRTSDIMFAQSRDMNQWLKLFSYESGTPAELGWRAMEIYLKFVAYQGLMGATDLPSAKDKVEVRSPESVKYGTNDWIDLPTIAPNAYADPNCFSDRTFLVKYRATTKFGGRKFDDVTEVEVEAHLQPVKRNSAPVHLLKKTYLNRTPFELEDALLDAQESAIEEKQFADCDPSARFALVKDRHGLGARALWDKWEEGLDWMNESD